MQEELAESVPPHSSCSPVRLSRVIFNSAAIWQSCVLECVARELETPHQDQMILQDLAELVQDDHQRKRDAIETRGLELFCAPERVYKKGATKRYILTIVHKDSINRHLAGKLGSLENG